MFEHKNWFRELIVIVLIALLSIIICSTFAPFPFSIPVSIGLIIFVVWIIRKNSLQEPDNT
jgi:hypothetical protein